MFPVPIYGIIYAFLLQQSCVQVRRYSPDRVFEPPQQLWMALRRYTKADKP